MYVFPSHLAVGYLCAKSLKKIVNSKLLFSTVLISAVFPDIDGIFSDTIAGHHSILHTPSIWIIILAGLWIISKITNNIFYKYMGFAIFVGAFSHLLMDWFAARTVGIQWLYPFSLQDFHLYPLNKEMGAKPISSMMQKEFITFYMSNTLLFWSEIWVNIIALIILLKQKFLQLTS